MTTFNKAKPAELVCCEQRYLRCISRLKDSRPMVIQRCSDPQELEAVWQELCSEQGSALFAFFGSEDPGTGASWCKDCVTADPVLRSACRRLRPDLTLYECPVGERSEWKEESDHPYRVHPQWHLERIPTLVLIEGGCERGRLGEADCQDEAVVAAFLATARA